ncbi:16460_t:CDS:2 [Funneliformis geosporum]|uniref:3706_t:CDS:1 n=1 Tax=Funneliformis geosporum TaxID=1117311 RepID=A0A9W4SI75_9GLOM|nr:16460_t:CDS:2 [Funneliformis geosporum]CAI2170469.1 3706_t:CDS:2 [Funneliformis geosporum]
MDESIMTSIIYDDEYSFEEKIQLISRVNQNFIKKNQELLDSKQQIINEQTQLIKFQQRLLDMLQEKQFGKCVCACAKKVENNKVSNMINDDLIELFDDETVVSNNSRGKPMTGYEEKCGRYLKGIKPCYKVYIGNLPPQISMFQLKKYLNELFGNVDYIYKVVPNDKWAFALFSDYNSCKKAISQGSVRFHGFSVNLQIPHERDYF